MDETFADGAETDFENGEQDFKDFTSDHLMVIDTWEDKLVGTYRLICSQFSEDYSSASEFDLSNFLKRPGVKLELSRACIHLNFRKGPVLHLLWRGLATYLKAVDASFLFGCASLPDFTQTQAQNYFRFLEKTGHTDPQSLLEVKEEYKIPSVGATLSEEEAFTTDQFPLLDSYIKVGAKICSEPAWDDRFQCADLFVVFNLKEMNSKFAKKYLG